MSSSLEVSNLLVKYDHSVVIDGVSLAVGAGTTTCLLGSNGSGKTTLIRSIVGLKPSDRGSIRLNGREISREPAHRIVAAGLSCIPEGRRVFPKLTVSENLRMGAYQQKEKKVILARLAEVFEVFPRLKEREHQLAGTMSGGEQAMLSIGRGIMGHPRLLIIDEPSLGLSPLFVKETFRLIREISQRGITVLLVEQNVHQTLDIADYGFVLSKGRIRASGTPEQLRNDPEVQGAYFGLGNKAHAQNPSILESQV